MFMLAEVDDAVADGVRWFSVTVMQRIYCRHCIETHLL